MFVKLMAVVARTACEMMLYCLRLQLHAGYGEPINLTDCSDCL